VENTTDLKIAIIHDWLTGMRGGEKVLELIIELFPNSDIYTLVHNKGSVSQIIESRPIFSSFIDRLPFKKNQYPYYLPLFPTAIEMFDLKKYDFIFSTSHCAAKGVRIPPTAFHVSYIHSPMRYVWDMYEDYFAKERLNFFSRKIIPLWANYLRMWDVTSSNRVDEFIANSQHVARRISKYYRRTAEVIHPPVDTELFQISRSTGSYFLIVSALVPYKRIDLAIQVFNRINKPLVILGEGPEESFLKKIADKNIKFIGWQPAETLKDYYSECIALVFPGEEDFGITPVEAQACGKPVIAYARGGALETVVGYDGSNERKCSGIFFYEQSESSLSEALTQFNQLNWDTEFMRKNSERFSKERFKSEISAFVNKKIESWLPSVKSQ
jgi:glycosyltransferase involved in cell wall biosynthesis